MIHISNNKFLVWEIDSEEYYSSDIQLNMLIVNTKILQVMNISL